MKYNRLIILTLALASFGLFVNAQGKMNGRTNLFIDDYKNAEIAPKKNLLKSISANDENSIPVTIILRSEADDISSILSQCGAFNCVKIGRVITANIPFSAFDSINSCESVLSLDVAQEMNLVMDSARITTNANKIHLGSELAMPYKGKGVIIGVVDSGIDYRHPNFRNADGSSRIVRIYDPTVSGASTSINGVTLPGEEYSSLEYVDTDLPSESHGTHTSGIAGGSFSEDGLQGMAPEADLVLCGLGSKLNSTNIINAVKYIVAFAKSVGKPAVINLSIGAHSGPHDGSSAACIAFDELAKDAIIVIASGNEGEDKLYVHKTFNDIDNFKTTPQFETILASKSKTDQCNFALTRFDFWTRSEKSFGIQYFVLNKKTNEVVAESEIFYPEPERLKTLSWKSTEDTNLAKYFNGMITAYGQLQSSNKKYNLFASITGRPITNGSFLIGMRLFGEGGLQVDCWNTSGDCDFISNGVDKYSEGDASFSVNDMATGQNTISIGAYCSKQGFKYLDRDATLTFDKNTLEGDICKFSSYGIDINGDAHPFVTAPGMAIISSVNSFDTGHYPRAKSSYEHFVDGTYYYWAPMAGTSMATPAATGIIALWLQAKKDLKVDEVKQIIKDTAINDDFVKAGDDVQWGNGKIDAFAGIKAVLSSSGIHDVSADDNAWFIYPNPSNGLFSIFVKEADPNLNLSIFSTNGSLVYSAPIQSGSQGLINIDISGYLNPGLYILKLTGTNTSISSKLIIR